MARRAAPWKRATVHRVEAKVYEHSGADRRVSRWIHRPWKGVPVALVVLTALPGLVGCRHRSGVTPSYDVPTVVSFERRVRDYLEDTTVGEQTFEEYLTDLDVVGCLEMEEEQLVEALRGLRRLHRVTYERASGPGRMVMWDVWRRRLAPFSADGRALVETFVDQPALGQAYFFCDDDLPTAWRNLQPDDFTRRAAAFFDAEIEVRHDVLRRDGADAAGAVVALDDLRTRIERRFEAQFGAGESDAFDALAANLDDLWDRKVDPHDLGRPVLLVRQAPVPDPREALQATQPGLPATYSDHSDAANRGGMKYAPGWVPPKAGGIGGPIPDPDDVARRNAIVRSWKQSRRVILGEARELARRAAELEEALAAAPPQERAAMLREIHRLASSVDHLSADLTRQRDYVAGFTSGRAGTDRLVVRAKRKELKRIRRKRRVVEESQDEVQQVVERVQEQVRIAAVAGASGGAGGSGATGDASSTAADADGEGVPPDGSGVTEASAEGSALTYEGPCPPPDPAWSDDVVAELRAHYPRIDDIDARIFLSLLQRVRPGSRHAVEAVVLEHLRQGIDLRLRVGRADELSDHYDPALPDDQQEAIVFYVWLGE